LQKSVQDHATVENSSSGKSKIFNENDFFLKNISQPEPGYGWLVLLGPPLRVAKITSAHTGDDRMSDEHEEPTQPLDRLAPHAEEATLVDNQPGVLVPLEQPPFEIPEHELPPIEPT
jgi:hypothetical protein